MDLVLFWEVLKLDCVFNIGFMNDGTFFDNSVYTVDNEVWFLVYKFFPIIYWHRNFFVLWKKGKFQIDMIKFGHTELFPSVIGTETFMFCGKR